jgi:NitT/TauT family transport system permease protein
MIWFHSSFVPVFVGILMITPIVFENTLQGILHIDTQIVQMSKVYNIPTALFLRKIAIPYTKPYLSAAVSLSLGIGFKAVVSAEVLCRPSIGIGAAIYDAKIYLETPQLFALTITVILLSFLFEKLIGNFVRRKGGTPQA